MSKGSGKTFWRDDCLGAEFRVAARRVMQNQARATTGLPGEAINQHKMPVVANERASFAKFGRDSDQYKKLRAADPFAGYKPMTGASDSIMFTGQKVYPAHYIPIWACLSTMTREFVDPTDWKIAQA